MDQIPSLTAPDSLSGLTLGISVSDSADLGRLGLADSHAELAIGEVARAVFVAGGSVLYGGRLKPSGFTQFLMHELRRYGRGPDALTIVLAEPEHTRMTASELRSADQELGAKGRLVFLDAHGRPIQGLINSMTDSPEARQNSENHTAGYSSMRTYLATNSDARFLLGGQLTGFKGVMPGIIEEAIASVKQLSPLYVAAGFGGASALVARTLGINNLSWAPEDFPADQEDSQVISALSQLAAAESSTDWSIQLNRLTELEQGQLAASHRPGEIASIIVKGLSRIDS